MASLREPLVQALRSFHAVYLNGIIGQILYAFDELDVELQQDLSHFALTHEIRGIELLENSFSTI